MNLGLLDWGIVAAMILFMVIAARRTKKYTRSVADFLAANRCAGRYVISVADTMALIGAIMIVGAFEAYYRVGFTFCWWALLQGIMFFQTLSGWIQYRFRETRAMTMAQFLEIRYSKRFRIFAGATAFVSGIMAFGLYPAVGARFFIYFCGLPSYQVDFLGLTTIDLTYAGVMIILLLIALYFTFVGGQIAVIVTDFIQGTFGNICFLIIFAFLLIKFPWPDILQTVLQRPAGRSMIDPFDIGDFHAFNMWFFILHSFAGFWCFMAYQVNQGYSCSARNAHEARMGKAFGTWRMSMQGIPIVFVAVCAYVIMQHPSWSGIASQVRAILVGTPSETIREQVTTTVVMSKFLPIGLLGAFCAMMLAAFISTHDTALHSWGSIFIQDVVLPLRKKRLSPKQHLKLLRWSIFGVAVWIFLFSLFFSQYDVIFMFFALTEMIFLGGGGTVIVFGLYWKKGTTAAAYTSLTVGIIGFIFSFAAQKLWPYYHGGESFPINSKWLNFYAIVISIVLYLSISLLSRRKAFNIERMLHRGKYAIAEDDANVTDKPVRGWQAALGMSREFTRLDKILYCFIGSWAAFWFIFLLIVVIYRAFYDISDEMWSKYWQFQMWLGLVLSSITTVWFTIGGISDLKKMFHSLKTRKIDLADDGEILAQPDDSDQ